MIIDRTILEKTSPTRSIILVCAVESSVGRVPRDVTIKCQRLVYAQQLHRRRDFSHTLYLHGERNPRRILVKRDTPSSRFYRLVPRPSKLNLFYSRLFIHVA